MALNRVLQVIGVAIIVASLSAIGYTIQLSQRNTTNIHQPSPTYNIFNTGSSNINKQTSLSSKNNNNPHIVEVPFGDGKGSGYNSEYYLPSRMIVHRGDSIEWINHDTVGHTVTAVTFNSGLIWPQQSAYGPSSFSHRFDKPGTYAYFCQIHPYMSGVVFADVQETQRVLNTTIGSTHYINVRVEMPQNAAYQNNYGPYFIPSYALVTSGTHLTWTNKDYVAHTATATDRSFDTEPILPGESRTITVDHNPGTIGYYCEIHPWMQATIDVSPSSTFRPVAANSK